jgi:hypothetical protein
VSLIDVFWLLVWLAASVVGGAVGFERWGVPGAIGGGLGAAVGWFALYGTVKHFLSRTITPLLPSCRSDKTGRHVYRSVGKTAEESKVICECGMAYVLVFRRGASPTRFMVIDDERRIPFMKLSHRKWVPDDSVLGSDPTEGK